MSIGNDEEEDKWLYSVIHNLPDEVRARLHKRAVCYGLSMKAEASAILTAACVEEEDRASGTVSLPFAAAKNRRVAVKLIHQACGCPLGDRICPPPVLSRQQQPYRRFAFSLAGVRFRAGGSITSARTMRAGITKFVFPSSKAMLSRYARTRSRSTGAQIWMGNPAHCHCVPCRSFLIRDEMSGFS